MSADLYTIGQLVLEPSGELIPRIAGAMTKAANAVFLEASSTANHTERLAWANAFVKGDKATRRTMAEQMLCRAAADNTTLQDKNNTIPDGDLEWVVNYFVNAVATNS